MRKTIQQATTLLDALAEAFPDSSKTTLRQMLQSGRVRVNSEIEKNSKRDLRQGDALDIAERAAHATLPAGLAILHEDQDVIVVLKSQGLLTVATERERDTTAQAYLNRYLAPKKGEDRIQVVHRLDRETSGVLVFAKNAYAREQLKEQFAAHSVDRIYIAITEGVIEPPSGTFRSFLREQRDLKMVSVKEHPEAKLAITHYRTIKTSTKNAMLEVTLETGRKNQIRAHLSEAGHPIIGDRMYGATTNPIARLGLHAKLLGFDHPVNGRHLVFTAPVPDSFEKMFR